MATKDTEPKKPDDSGDGSGPMLDMSQAAVKKMMATARARGYITYDELNEVLPPDQVTSEQIEDVMAMLSEMGINVVDNEEADEDDAARDDAPPAPEESGSRELAMTSVGGEALDRTDDPVRMYLREMGSVELLSREGEIAIAKRIEAGRNTMIAGLCESPLTFQAITVWRDELLDEAIMLRDVIDLETTFSGQMEHDEVESVMAGLKPEVVAPAPAPTPKPAPAQPAAAASRPEPARRAAATSDDEEDDEEAGDEPLADEEEEEAPRPDPEEEEDDDQGSLSLAAMEAALKPQVLETLERIAHDYVRLAEMQDSRLSATLNRDETFSTNQERDYQRLRSEIVELVNSLHLHQNRIDTLVDQLYGINRKIMTLDGSMVKLADQARISRQEFIDEYRGAELEPGWLDRVGKLRSRGWDQLVTRFRDKADEVRQDMAEVGQYVGVDISEFRRIVNQVQKGEKEARQAKNRDIAHPDSEAQAGDVAKVLAELGIDVAAPGRIIEVWNKIDLIAKRSAHCGSPRTARIGSRSRSIRSRPDRRGPARASSRRLRSASPAGAASTGSNSAARASPPSTAFTSSAKSSTAPTVPTARPSPPSASPTKPPPASSAPSRGHGRKSSNH